MNCGANGRAAWAVLVCGWRAERCTLPRLARGRSEKQRTSERATVTCNGLAPGLGSGSFADELGVGGGGEQCRAVESRVRQMACVQDGIGGGPAAERAQLKNAGLGNYRRLTRRGGRRYLFLLQFFGVFLASAFWLRAPRGTARALRHVSAAAGRSEQNIRAVSGE